LRIRAFNFEILCCLIFEGLVAFEFLLKQEFLHELSHGHIVSLENQGKLEGLLGVMLIQRIHHEGVVLSLDNHSSPVSFWRDIDAEGSRVDIVRLIEQLWGPSLSELDSQVCLQREHLCHRDRKLDRINLDLIHMTCLGYLPQNI
jgi:hypothetical protein